MKKSPVPCLFKSFATVLTLTFCFTACQNAGHIVATDDMHLTRPAASAVQEHPAPPSFSSEYSVTALYKECQCQWGLFSAWLSSGMMQPHRTVFPR